MKPPKCPNKVRKRLKTSKAPTKNVQLRFGEKAMIPDSIQLDILCYLLFFAGSECKDKSSSEEIAKKTLDCLKKNVPNKVPGIAFLSGGQSEIESSKNLNEINKINDSNFLITFSYGRGLQASALKEFGKNQSKLENIQKAFNHRAKMNGLSSKGEWSENLEKESAA